MYKYQYVYRIIAIESFNFLQYILTKLNNVSATIKMDRQKGGVTHASLITDLPSW